MFECLIKLIVDGFLAACMSSETCIETMIIPWDES